MIGKAMAIVGGGVVVYYLADVYEWAGAIQNEVRLQERDFEQRVGSLEAVAGRNTHRLVMLEEWQAAKIAAGKSDTETVTSFGSDREEEIRAVLHSSDDLPTPGVHASQINPKRPEVDAEPPARRPDLGSSGPSLKTPPEMVGVAVGVPGLRSVPPNARPVVPEPPPFTGQVGSAGTAGPTPRTPFRELFHRIRGGQHVRRHGVSAERLAIWLAMLAVVAAIGLVPE